jgi:2-(1,2-epoxy-1,2-dihydrophenyl)acetyl-CoA isomerase
MSNPAPSPAPVLLEETIGGVRILRLNRPAKKNALSNELTWAIIHAFEAAAADDAVRVVGLTGEGDAFCSGADLRARKPSASEGAKLGSVEEGAVAIVTGIRVRCEKPVIAGIGGIAIGAGLSLALCADIRLASASARFHPGYARAATSPDCGLSWTLTQAIGRERTMRFLLEQEMLDAKAALALGLVSEVIDQDGFDAAFLAYCQKIAEVAPIAARQTKRLVTRVGLIDDLEAHLRLEIEYAKRGLMSADGKEAVRAIFEKRKPEFEGR